MRDVGDVLVAANQRIVQLEAEIADLRSSWTASATLVAALEEDLAALRGRMEALDKTICDLPRQKRSPDDPYGLVEVDKVLLLVRAALDAPKVEPFVELLYCGKCNQRRYFLNGKCEVCAMDVSFGTGEKPAGKGDSNG